VWRIVRQLSFGTKLQRGRVQLRSAVRREELWLRRLWRFVRHLLGNPNVFERRLRVRAPVQRQGVRPGRLWGLVRLVPERQEL
jgi:hypothetical protein